MTRAFLVLLALLIGLFAAATATEEEKRKPSQPPLGSLALMVLAIVAAYLAGAQP